MTAVEETWSNEKCLELLDVYEKHSELWDIKHPQYYTKAKRTESWQKVADHFDADITCIKRKMCSLMGSFRAQKAKGKEIVGEGANLKEVYVSKWFAFERMMFLLGKTESQQNFGSNEYDVINEETFDTYVVKCENDSDVEFVDNSLQSPNRQENEPQDVNSTNISYTVKENFGTIHINNTLTEIEELEAETNSNPRSELSGVNNEYAICRKRNTDIDQNLLDNKEGNFLKRKGNENISHNLALKNVRIEPTRNSKENFCETSEADTTPISNNNNIFGFYVNHKLQGYSSKTRAIAEHAINNILFEADMGWYENSSPQRQKNVSYS